MFYQINRYAYPLSCCSFRFLLYVVKTRFSARHYIEKMELIALLYRGKIVSLNSINQHERRRILESDTGLIDPIDPYCEKDRPVFHDVFQSQKILFNCRWNSDLSLPTSCNDGVLKEACYGHRAHPTWYWGDCSGYL